MMKPCSLLLLLACLLLPLAGCNNPTSTPASTSEIIDLALDRIIRAERLRRDLAAYRRVPPTDAELELALLAQTAALDDDTDWAALYADDDQ